jgi:hypothetical protein
MLPVLDGLGCWRHPYGQMVVPLQGKAQPLDPDDLPGYLGQAPLA